MVLRLPVLFVLPWLALAQEGPRRPLAVDYTRTTNYRWLNKPVTESRLLDDMENASSWTLENRGAAQGEMSLTGERARDGAHSLRLRSNTMGARPGKTMGRPPGSASVVRKIDGEDWTRYQRISFWVYPDLPGFHSPSLLLVFHNDGRKKVPNLWKDGLDFVLLRNREWNLVTSEIAHLPRDKVTAVELQYRLQGNQPHAASTVQFDFDRLALEVVEPDYFEGWAVWPDRISFSHTGYQTGSQKTAIAGGVTTQPFRIGDNVWRETILKTLNFFYTERCGYAAPGVHGVKRIRSGVLDVRLGRAPARARPGPRALPAPGGGGPLGAGLGAQDHFQRRLPHHLGHHGLLEQRDHGGRRRRHFAGLQSPV